MELLEIKNLNKKYDDKDVHKDKVQENTHQHDQKQKAGPASSVKAGAFHHVFHREGMSVLHTVDGLMLGSVIAVYTLDVGHQRDDTHIADKDCDSNDALDDACRKGAVPTGQCRYAFGHQNRKEEEQSDGQ